MLKETLHIVTVCGRLQALASLASSIAYNAHPDLDIYWHVSIQSREDKYGAEQFRDIFKKIDYGWVWPLCDDNVVHSEFFERLVQEIKYSAQKVKVFSQKRMDKTGNLTASPENVVPCKIDGNQAVIHSSILRSYEFDCGEGRSRNDGLLLEAIYKDHPEEFQFINEPITYFNAMTWLTKDLV